MVNFKFSDAGACLVFTASSRMALSVKTHFHVYINNVSFHKKRFFFFCAMPD